MVYWFHGFQPKLRSSGFQARSRQALHVKPNSYFIPPSLFFVKRSLRAVPSCAPALPGSRRWSAHPVCAPRVHQRAGACGLPRGSLRAVGYGVCHEPAAMGPLRSHWNWELPSHHRSDLLRWPPPRTAGDPWFPQLEVVCSLLLLKWVQGVQTERSQIQDVHRFKKFLKMHLRLYESTWTQLYVCTKKYLILHWLQKSSFWRWWNYSLSCLETVIIKMNWVFKTRRNFILKIFCIVCEFYAKNPEHNSARRREITKSHCKSHTWKLIECSCKCVF